MVSRAGHSADLSGPVMTRALCHFDNAYWLPDVAMHGYCGQDQHAEQHRLPRLRRAAGRDRDREHPRQRSRARWASDPLDVRRVNFYGTTSATSRPTARSVDDNIIHELVAELEASSDYRARRAAIARLQRRQPGAQARPGADAGEVRHLVQRQALQPGRRAGARLHRRLDPGEPRRHRDGPGPEHQGGAGGGARAGRALRARARAPPPTRRRSPTPRPPPPRPAAT